MLNVVVLILLSLKLLIFSEKLLVLSMSVMVEMIRLWLLEKLILLMI